MCGIAGIITKDGRAPDAALLDKLAAGLKHRGPDGEGRHVRGPIGLVHQRLAIIDVTGGHQPLHGPQGRELVCNGEIYNDPELRRSLANERFNTKSDCEPIMHVFGARDHAFVDRLRGMYGFALDDPSSDTLTLARDAFGIKPLYITHGPIGLAFASEPSALLAAGLAPRALDVAAAGELLQLQFVTGTKTPFRGIERLPVGAVWTIENGKVTSQTEDPFWRRRLARSPSGEAALKDFEAIFLTSVELHLRSDVPYGLFLSGGIDSAAVLAAMTRLVDEPVRCFTAYFPETKAADERAQAQAVAKSVDAHHIEVAVTQADFWRHLPAIAKAMDDPVADYAIVPTWLLAREATKSVKVVLSGEGGDELFGGYGRYRAAQRPWPFAKPMWRKGRMDGLGVLREEPKDWRAGLAVNERAIKGGSALQRAQRLDMAEWLANDLLLKLDRCLMAHGVEGRVPFLDPEVAAFALGLPDGEKVRGRLGKWLLRTWLEGAMPAANAFARKQGFTVPVAHWIAGQGKRLGELLSAHGAIAAIAHPAAVRAVCERAGESSRAGFAAWTLLFYALWHGAHIAERPADTDTFTALSSG
ncbi:MAG: asparagine synthase (glutamine-hydrolyzing) [Alphaproteobacteria bacterium]